MVKLDMHTQTVIFSCLLETGERNLEILYKITKNIKSQSIVTRSTLRNWLYLCEEEGLIESNVKGNSRIYKITKKGENKLEDNKNFYDWLYKALGIKGDMQ